MTNLSIFQFETREVRVVEINGEPWFVAKDACDVLELTNPSASVNSLDEDEKAQLDPKQYLGSASNQAFWAINEPGLYSLIFRSRKPQAKSFKRWIAHEVLPAIRNTGEYRVTPQPQRPLPPVRDIVDYLRVAQDIPDVENPIIRAALEQRLAEELGANRALPGASGEELVLVAVLAREMGYDLAPGEDAQLGKWVRKHHEPKGKTQHGRYPVNVYDRYEIEETVRAFFR